MKEISFMVILGQQELTHASVSHFPTIRFSATIPISHASKINQLQAM